jgi:hypothetical protein
MHGLRISCHGRQEVPIRKCTTYFRDGDTTESVYFGGWLRFNVAQCAKKLDGLLDLLNATADALASTWDEYAEFNRGDDFKTTIQ